MRGRWIKYLHDNPRGPCHLSGGRHIHQCISGFKNIKYLAIESLARRSLDNQFLTLNEWKQSSSPKIVEWTTRAWESMGLVQSDRHAWTKFTTVRFGFCIHLLISTYLISGIQILQTCRKSIRDYRLAETSTYKSLLFLTINIFKRLRNMSGYNVDVSQTLGSKLWSLFITSHLCLQGKRTAAARDINSRLAAFLERHMCEASRAVIPCERCSRKLPTSIPFGSNMIKDPDTGTYRCYLDSIAVT